MSTPTEGSKVWQILTFWLRDQNKESFLLHYYSLFFQCLWSEPISNMWNLLSDNVYEGTIIFYYNTYPEIIISFLSSNFFNSRHHKIKGLQNRQIYIVWINQHIEQKFKTDLQHSHFWIPKFSEKLFSVIMVWKLSVDWRCDFPLLDIGGNSTAKLISY